MADSGIFETGSKQIKEKDKLKEAAKEGLDVMPFIAGETPTQRSH